MTAEDEEFNRIEKEAAMRKAAVMVAITKRQWIGLTDDEIDKIVWNLPYEPDKKDIRAIENLLRNKNT